MIKFFTPLIGCRKILREFCLIYSFWGWLGMLVKATLSFAMKLPPKPANPIHETLVAFRNAVRHAVNWCIENKTINLAKAHHNLYYKLKEAYRLPARLALDTIRQGIWIAKGWLKNPKRGRRPIIRKLSMILTPKQSYSFSWTEASILTVEGRKTVARRGRKRNLLFIINTQMARDVLEGPGRVLVENCATKILLSQEASAAKYVSEAFNLPKYEVEVLPDLTPGRAFMIADAIHIPIAFYASDEEFWYFTTKPEERAKMCWGETA